MKRPCRICHKRDYRPYGFFNGFHLERCCNCSLMQVTEDLSHVDLKTYYDQTFFEDTYSPIHNGHGRTAAYQKYHHRLNEIERLRPGRGRILDVGCSFGYFLDAARSRGWTPTGVEIGEYAASVAIQELGIDVHVSDVMSVDLPKGHFDVLTMWDVVEHFDDPVSELRHLHGLLKPGGVLAFNTPNVDSYLRKLQGRRWRCFIPPIHVTNFGPQSVKALLQGTGFRPLLQTVALPREALLQKLRLFNFLEKIGFSDKMLVFAAKA